MRVRPMEPADAEAVYAVSLAAFADLDLRLGGRPEPATPGSGAAYRVGRIQRTDPGGAWVAERDGEIARGRARVAAPPDVRPGTADDLPLTERVDRAVRGSAHGEDILALVEAGSRLLVLPERGYALVRGGEVRLLAAFDEDGAATLLRGCLAAADGAESTVEFITSAQNWAVAPCVEAGLELRSEGGAVFVSGDVGPFAPYLPSGTYL